MAISTGWSICNNTSNSIMNHHIVLLASFLHLKCTSVESPIGIGINCFLGERKNMRFQKKTRTVSKWMNARQKALDVSSKASQYMVKRELRRNPPSLYYKGETVLIRVPVSKKLVKGEKNSL